MEEAAAVALVRRFYEELWGHGQPDVAYELFADEYVRHDLRPGVPVAGPAGQVQIATSFRAAFPDLEVALDVVVAGDEHVVARWTMTGTHTGTWGTTPPTGRRATFSGVNIFRFENDKVVELWNHRDDLGLMQQLGAAVYAGATTS